jgi:hypothetical protein
MHLRRVVRVFWFKSIRTIVANLLMQFSGGHSFVANIVGP